MQGLDDVKPERVKKGIKGAESREKRDDIALRVCDMIEASRNAIEPLTDRWKRNQSFYNNVPDYHYMQDQGTELPPDAPDHHMPLVQPIVDTLVESVVQPIIAMRPYCFASYIEGGRAENVENDVSFLMERGDFELAMWDASVLTGITGLGHFYIPFEVKTQKMLSVGKELPGTAIDVQIPLNATVPLEDGREVELSDISFAGPVFYTVHPEDMSVYPISVKVPDRMNWIGHGIDMRLQEVRERQTAGIWFADEPVVPSNQEDESAGRDSQQDLTSKFNVTEVKDETARVYCGEVRLDLDEDGIEEKYYVAVASDQKILLDIVPLTRKKSKYVQMRMSIEHNTYYPQGSVANSLQGNQLFYNEMHNILLDSARHLSGPFTIMKGEPPDGQTVTKYNPWQILWVPDDIQKETIEPKIDLSAASAAIAQIEKQSFASAGLSQNDLGQKVPGDITATEDVNLKSFGTLRQTGYRLRAGISVERAAEVVYEHYKANYLLLKALYGGLLKATPEDMSKPVIFRLAGSSTIASPGQQIQMLQTLVQLIPALISLDPSVQHSVDPMEILTGFLDASGLNIAEKVVRPPDEAARAMRLAQIQQIVGESFAEFQNTQSPEVPVQALQAIVQVLTTPMEDNGERAGAEVPEGAGMGVYPGLPPVQALGQEGEAEYAGAGY